jgi:hypothetical protein
MLGYWQRYGRCEPRGSGGTADRTIALVAKARDGDGLMAIVAETNAAPSRVLRTTNMHNCSVLHLAIKQELVRCCGSEGKSQTSDFTCIAVCPQYRLTVARYDQCGNVHMCTPPIEIGV